MSNIIYRGYQSSSGGIEEPNENTISTKSTFWGDDSHDFIDSNVFTLQG